MLTIALLLVSNAFMTLAWYGQPRFPNWTIATAILVGWGIALFEYCFAIPANRVGYAHGFTGGQLKIIQEIITLSVFAVFATVVLREPLSWRYAGAFACICGAAAFISSGAPNGYLGWKAAIRTVSLAVLLSTHAARTVFPLLTCEDSGRLNRA